MIDTVASGLIDSGGPFGLVDATRTSRSVHGTGSAAPMAAGALVTLSERALFAQRVATAAHSASGMDNTRVAAVRSSIEDGSYVLSPTITARGLLNAIQGDHE